MEKTVRVVGIVPKVGRTSGKPYFSIMFDDGSKYNWQPTSKPQFVMDATYKLLTEKNGDFDNIKRAELVTAGVATPAATPEAPAMGDTSALMDVFVANNALLGEILNALNTAIQMMQVPK